MNFPHVGQVVCIERRVTKLDGTPMPGERREIEVAYAVTSLDGERASAARLLELNRGHWTIENRLHHVRDMTFDEDRSRVRRHGTAQVMAALRNLAISVLRIAGAEYIAQAVRWCTYRGQDAVLRLIGLSATRRAAA